VWLGVLVVLAPARLETLGLAVLRKTGDEVGMTGGDLFVLERLGNLRHKLQQGETRIDVARALAALTGYSGDVISGKGENPTRILPGVM
jgi:hypothetical protein